MFFWFFFLGVWLCELYVVLLLLLLVGSGLGGGKVVCCRCWRDGWCADFGWKVHGGGQGWLIFALGVRALCSFRF